MKTSVERLFADLGLERKLPSPELALEIIRQLGLPFSRNSLSQPPSQHAPRNAHTKWLTEINDERPELILDYYERRVEAHLGNIDPEGEPLVA